MTDDIVIRQFEQNDKALVNNFFDSMGFETKMFFNRNDCNRKKALKFFDSKTSSKTHSYWLAFDGKKMVGYVFLWDIDKTVVWLGIAVADDLKGKGLGTRLTNTVVEYAKENNKGGILLTTHTSNFRGQALYEKCGFEKIGSAESREMLYILRF